MSHGPTVIDALERAVAESPSADAVRLHLADVLIESGEHALALEHVQVVLNACPDHVEALGLAASACAGMGDSELSARYTRLHDSLAETADATESGGVTDGPAVNPSEVVRLRLVADQRSGEAPDDVEAPGVTLGDVAGLEEVKRRLRTGFLTPMQSPELRQMYRKSLRGGLLLYGPPGCGKTLLARALAGELSADFYSVGLHEVLDMYLGESEKNLHEIFETARRHAPCVLFLDEVDALGQKRSHLSHSAGRNVVVQLLAELDGLRDDNEGVFVLGATNQPWDVDTALRRPGRFDRIALVLPPDTAARSAILEYHLRDRPLADGIDYRWLSGHSAGYSGADLRLVCDSAAELALEASLDTGTPRSISMSDLKAALKDVRPSTRPWFEVAKNYAMFANDGGQYDDLLSYMRDHKLA